MAAAAAVAPIADGSEEPPVAAGGSGHPPTVQDHQRGHTGWVLEDAFKDLFQPQKAGVEAKAELARDAGDLPAGEGAEGTDIEIPAAEGAPQSPALEAGEIDTTGEEAEIAEIQSSVHAEHERIDGVVGYLHKRRGEAMQRDRDEAEQLQARWGLVVREQVPVPESKLKTLLDPNQIDAEGLVHARDMMLGVERQIEIKKGTLLQHDNLLSISKPEEPNHFKSTASMKVRATTRKVHATLTEAQRTALSEEMEERRRLRPVMPRGLTAEEQARNREIIRKMQMKVNFVKNPRFVTDRGAAGRGESCPFHFTPASIVFRNYEVGGIYELSVELRNVTHVGRRLRAMPCPNPAFSLCPLRHEGDVGRTAAGADPSSVVAPGMAAHLTVRFSPSTLNDATEEVIISTEFGDYALPVLARRVQPQLDFEEPVSCGCMLAGSKITKAVRLTNHGGEGSFRLLPADASAEAPEYHYETGAGDETTFVSKDFRVTPATFYLEADQTVDLEVRFFTEVVGQHRCPLLIEADNGERVPLTLVAITDAVRLELLHWPTLPDAVRPRAPPPGASPWSLVPWQLSWLSPGTQVGCSDSQAITISNGGYLPQKVEWCFARPPLALLSRLSTGGQQRLTDDLLAGIHHWTKCHSGSDECPFTVLPDSAIIAPFSTATFTFAFYAQAPVGHHATAFAYLVVSDIPAGGHCLLHFSRLLELQGSLQPDGYSQGLPLFGGAVSTLLDRRQAADAGGHGDGRDEIDLRDPHGQASCTLTAVCLQGRTEATRVACLPRVLGFSGDVLPFLTHTRELTLRNAGPMAAHFRVRLTSRARPLGADVHDLLWVVAAHEVGPRPTEAQPAAESVGAGEDLRLTAERLATLWPPLPPEGEAAASRPGFGALATVAAEPHEGRLEPGAALKVRVTLRALRESDINAHLVIDLPVNLETDTPAAPPLKVTILAAVRSPCCELRRTSFLDYGVVRAHARHTMKLCVDNPSDLPMLVQLRHQRDGGGGVGSIDSAAVATDRAVEDGGALGPSAEPDLADPCQQEAMFPVGSHQEAVNFFVGSVQRGCTGGFAPVTTDDLEASAVAPWVHSRSGCFDTSGRKRYKFKGRGAIPEDAGDSAFGGAGGGLVDDSVDFLFQPACLAVWPRQSAEVEVTLRTSEMGKYRALLEAVGFDSLQTRWVEVFAEVQLPRLRLSTQHAHFPVAYVQTPTAPLNIELRNDSDMPARFRWDTPVKLEECLAVQITPSEGSVAPRGAVEVTLVAVPTREAALAELLCRVFVDELIQPLVLKVSATVYGPEVDYAVVPMGELPPEIKHEPRKIGDEPCGTYQLLNGVAPPGTPAIDFGEMELLKSKTVKLVLYNRTGIALPFGARIDRNPAHDPLQKGGKLSRLLDAATRLYSIASPMESSTSGTLNDASRQSFANEPQPAIQGRQPSVEREEEGTLRAEMRRSTERSMAAGAQGTTQSMCTMKFEPKQRSGTVSTRSRRKTGQKKRLLLDDTHERVAFRSGTSVEFAKQKQLREQGVLALKAGHGWAVQVEPDSAWLEPFSTATLTLTCFSDLPGLLEDHLVLKVRSMPGHDDGDFRIPMRLLSFGNPLYLPEQQVGLNLRSDPPCMSCGTIVPAEKLATRTFRVGNNASTKIRISWKVYAQRQVDYSEEDRTLVAVALCGKDGCIDPFADDLSMAVENEGQDEDEEEGAAGAAKCVGAESLFQFQMCAEEPPGVKDPFALLATGKPPVSIEPEEAVIPVHGSATFTVRMMASKATATAASHYKYKLVGKGRFTEDRNVVLAPPADGNVQRDAYTQQPSVRDKVATLPAIQLDKEQLHDSDSDVEQQPGAQGVAQTTADTSLEATQVATRMGSPGSGGDGRGEPAPRPLAEEPERDVLSTIVVDCVGDCVLPRLSVDKKGNPAVEEYPRPDAAAGEGEETDAVGAGRPVHCPVFKFTHSAVPPPHMTAEDRRVGGMTHGAPPGGAQISGVASCLERQVTLSNHTPANIPCRFRTEGPFQVRLVMQAGRHPVQPTLNAPGRPRKKASGSGAAIEAPRQLFVVAKWETITVHVEFVPDMVPASEWKAAKAEHIFRGDLLVEYPRDASEDPNRGDGGTELADLQRIHLVANSRRPAVRITVVPNDAYDRPLKLEQVEQPPWAGPTLVVVEFGYVHVESSVSRQRVVLLSNETNVLAIWRLLHVGRKRRPAPHIGCTVREEEDFRALDDKDVFEFDVSAGELRGPSKDGLVPGSPVRMPRWCPVSNALPKAPPHPDEHLFEPQKISISFRPKKNELYKCQFRIQVESGVCIDFICRGCGSYDEEDDVMDFQEA